MYAAPFALFRVADLNRKPVFMPEHKVLAAADDGIVAKAALGTAGHL